LFSLLALYYVNKISQSVYTLTAPSTQPKLTATTAKSKKGK
jgi:hypothetical protein